MHNCLTSRRSAATRRWALGLLAVPALLLHACAQAHQVAADMSGAARQWLESLAPEQQRQAVFSFADAERENWHYIPKARQGLSLKQMDARQRELATALIRSTLSQHGQRLFEEVAALEQVLFELEGRALRDPDLYYFTVFGEPARQPWGWRLEGHHLSVNVTVIDGQVAVTPSFVGANPAQVKSGPRKGLRLLAKEEDLARSLVQSMDATQRGRTILEGEAPAEIITAADRQVRSGQDFGGIPVAQLNDTQRQQFVALLEHYAHRLRAELAEAELRDIMTAGWEREVRFAWIGPLEPGQGHYYRIHGPRFLIEYDNTQNNANHIHTVWRSFDGDFGRDRLREHYDGAHRR